MAGQTTRRSGATWQITRTSEEGREERRAVADRREVDIHRLQHGPASTRGTPPCGSQPQHAGGTQERQMTAFIDKRAASRSGA